MPQVNKIRKLIEKFNRNNYCVFLSLQQSVVFKLNSWGAGPKQSRNCDSSHNVQLAVELHAA